MANVTINDNTKYVRLNTLEAGEFFVLSGELYIVIDENYNTYTYYCYNLSAGAYSENEDDTRVIPVPDEKIKIIVEI